MLIKTLYPASILTGVMIINGNSLAQSDTIEAAQAPNQSEIRFNHIKTSLFAEPYPELPYYKVSRKLFGPAKNNEKNHLLTAAKRTFDDSADLIDFPSGQKLLNANGICFIGEWRITTPNPFTGLYKQGSTSTGIIRASVALSGTQQKHKRSFGMGIKLLPEGLAEAPSLNAFVLHSMGGIKTKHLLDLSMDNQPPLGRLPSFRDLSTALRLRSDLEKADKEQGASKPKVAYRPVNQFAQYSEEAGKAVSPKWLRLSPKTHERFDKNDFRDELDVSLYPDSQIKYTIEVAAKTENGKKKKADWLEIGELVLTDSVTSKACDSRLHFQHPKLDTND